MGKHRTASNTAGARTKVCIALAIVSIGVAAGFFIGKTGQPSGLGLEIEEVRRAYDAPLDEAGWRRLNEAALHLHKTGDPAGAVVLGRFLKWNKQFKRGVDLRGVDLKEVFGTINALNRMKLPEFALRGGAAGSIISLERCRLDGAKHPEVPLRWVRFEGALFDVDTLRQWASVNDGRGLSEALLNNVDLSGLKQEDYTFQEASLSYTGIQPKPKAGSGLDVLDRRYEGCLLDGVSFGTNNLTGLSLQKCMLVGSSISADQLLQAAAGEGGTGIIGAILPQVDLRGKSFDGIFLTGVDTKPIRADVPKRFLALDKEPGEETWAPVLSSSGDGGICLEMLPRGGSRTRWSEKVGWRFLPSKTSAGDAAEVMEKEMRAEDGEVKIKKRATQAGGGGILIAADSSLKGEISLVLVTNSEDGVMTLSYTFKKDKDSKKRMGKWLKRLEGARPVPTGGRIPISLFWG